MSFSSVYKPKKTPFQSMKFKILFSVNQYKILFTSKISELHKLTEKIAVYEKKSIEERQQR